MPRSRPSTSIASMGCLPASASSRLLSISVTGIDSVAIFWAMPLPILPAPTTATLPLFMGALLSRWCERGKASHTERRARAAPSRAPSAAPADTPELAPPAAIEVIGHREALGVGLLGVGDELAHLAQ